MESLNSSDVSLSRMCFFGVIPQLLNRSTSTWYTQTIFPAIRFLVSYTNISPQYIFHITIMYWLPLLVLTGSLHVWSDQIVSTRSSQRSLTLIKIYLFFFLGLVSVSTYSSSLGSRRFIFVGRDPKGVFRICPFCVSSDYRKCFCAVFSFRPGHNMQFPYLIDFSHVFLVGNPAAVC